MHAVTFSNGHLYFADKTCIHVLDVNGGEVQTPIRSPSSVDFGCNLALVRVYAQQDLIMAGDYFGRIHI
jgi:hypothetical protein